MSKINKDVIVVDNTKSDFKFNASFVISGLFIVALLMLIMQIYHSNTDIYKKRFIKDTSHHSKNRILIETNKGIIESDNKRILEELKQITFQLQKISDVQIRDKKINSQLKKSIKNLQQFINISKAPPTSVSGYAGLPEDSFDLEDEICTTELQHNLVDQAMIDSVNPNEYVYSKNYNTVLENEDETDSITNNNLAYLIKHLDIAIRFLRNDVCSGGKLDLTRLYKILYNLNSHLVENGKYHKNDNIYNGAFEESGGYGNYTPAKIAGESKSNVPLFLKETTNIEPFRGTGVGNLKYNPLSQSDNDSSENQVRGMPDKVNTKNNSNMFNKVEGFSVLQSTDQIVPWTVYKGKMFYDYANPDKINRDNNSIEATAERDIMHHKTPGSILSTMKDNTMYYAVRAGACGGTTPSDDQFFNECTSKDLTLDDAINGSPDKMLACVGECNREPNYMNYYSKIYESSAGTDSYGADFEIPKVNPVKKLYNI